MAKILSISNDELPVLIKGLEKSKENNLDFSEPERAILGKLIEKTINPAKKRTPKPLEPATQSTPEGTVIA